MAEGSIGGTPISSLPASSFAYCEPGDAPAGERCHFPIRDAKGRPDAAHVRAALSRLDQSPFGDKARARVEAAARELGIGQAGKATGEMKAEPMDGSRLDRWLSGRIPRRVLVLPFGGPIPAKGAPLGTDLDGEWFDRETDIFGEFPALRRTRERLVDWHHDQDPTGRMKGAVLGRVELDAEPEDDGYWADFWANAGEQRRELVARLERGGVPLYGSSQAVYKKARGDGHIDVWPLYRHTITTSPQNTRAVVPPLKAVLDAEDVPLDAVTYAAVKAALVGVDTIVDRFGNSPSAAAAASPAGGDALAAPTDDDLRRLADLVAATREWLTAVRP